MRRKCTFKGCDRWAAYCGLCNLHYKNPDPDAPRKPKAYGLGTRYPWMRTIYTNMKQRCLNPKNPNYKHYGGRGIKICDRWLGKDGVNNFIRDVGLRPDNEGRSIWWLDRIDPNGDYCPENCRWAHKWQQAGNTRKQKKYSQLRGVTYNEFFKRWEAYLTVDGHDYKEWASSEEEAYQKRLELEINIYLASIDIAGYISISAMSKETFAMAVAVSWIAVKVNIATSNWSALIAVPVINRILNRTYTVQ